METNQTQTLNPYQMKRAARIARLRERADALAGKGAAVLTRARQMAACIPFGQPIASNSYRQRDINFRNKIDQTMRRGCETIKAAGQAAAKADAAESNDMISSDDPEAVTLLEQKLAGMQACREKMKNINKAWRKDGVAGLIAYGISEENAALIAKRVEEAYSWEKQPYAGYQLTNLGANIRRVEERIQQLKTRATKAAEAPQETKEVCGVRIETNLADNRLRIFFPGKPSATIRDLLKRNGFKWSPMAGAWQRMPSTAATWAAEQVIDAYAKEAEAG